MKDLGVNGRIILKYILKTRGYGVQWVHLAVDAGRWRDLVHMVMDQLRNSKKQGIFLTTYNKLLAFFMFAPCINSIKAIFINPTEAHNYKITGMLKQLKFPQLLRHVSVHSGTIIREPLRA